MINFTKEQLEAWARCTAKDPEPITQDMWNERVALFSEAKLHGPALAGEVLRLMGEVERLRKLVGDAYVEGVLDGVLGGRDQWDKAQAKQALEPKP